MVVVVRITESQGQHWIKTRSRTDANKDYGLKQCCGSEIFLSHPDPSGQLFTYPAIFCQVGRYRTHQALNLTIKYYKILNLLWNFWIFKKYWVRNRNNRITDPDPDPQHWTLKKAFMQEKVRRDLLTVILAATAVTAAAATAPVTATRLPAMFAPPPTVILISWRCTQLYTELAVDTNAAIVSRYRVQYRYGIVRGFLCTASEVPYLIKTSFQGKFGYEWKQFFREYLYFLPLLLILRRIYSFKTI